MSVKIKRYKQIPCGLHKVKIVLVRFARIINKYNQEELYVCKDTGELKAVEIRFQDEQKRLYSGIFWLTDNGIWMLNKLLKAIHVDTSSGNKISVNDVLNKELFIVIANVYNVVNGKLNPIPVSTQLVPKFYQAIGPEDYRPCINGDPATDGEPSGIFAVYRKIENQEIVNPVSDTLTIDDSLSKRRFGDD